MLSQTHIKTTADNVLELVKPGGLGMHPGVVRGLRERYYPQITQISVLGEGCVLGQKIIVRFRNAPDVANPIP
jgi:hypothetical protein